MFRLALASSRQVLDIRGLPIVDEWMDLMRMGLIVGRESKIMSVLSFFCLVGLIAIGIGRLGRKKGTGVGIRGLAPAADCSGEGRQTDRQTLTGL